MHSDCCPCHQHPLHSKPWLYFHGMSSSCPFCTAVYPPRRDLPSPYFRFTSSLLSHPHTYLLLPYILFISSQVHSHDADVKTNSLSKNEIVSALSLHNEKNEIVSAHPLPKGNRPSSFHDLTGKIEEWNSKEQKPGCGLAGDIRAPTGETPSLPWILGL